jgi:hypothetical protein
MLDLAISTDTDSKGTTIVQTNHGVKLKAPRWPQDCESQLVAFSPSGVRCEVVWTELLAADIDNALAMLDGSAAFKGPKPDWYRRLKRCARGASAVG